MEEWVEVRGFPDYLISNFGRVYSSKTDIIMKSSILSSGYLAVCFTDNRVQYTKNIHRMVAEAFVPGWDFGLEVNHIDADKLNNHESNLEWTTPSENIRHALNLGLRKPNPKKKVIINDITGQVFPSISECAEFYKTRPSTIGRVLTGSLKSWKGYTFSYVE